MKEFKVIWAVCVNGEYKKGEKNFKSESAADRFYDKQMRKFVADPKVSTFSFRLSWI